VLSYPLIFIEKIVYKIGDLCLRNVEVKSSIPLGSTIFSKA